MQLLNEETQKSKQIEKAPQMEILERKKLVEETQKQEEQLKEMAAEQKELLLQARLSLEQIRFREKLLDQLYHKIRKKYRL